MYGTYPTMLGGLSGGELVEQTDVGGTGAGATFHDASAIWAASKSVDATGVPADSSSRR